MNLSLSATETWCLENVGISATGVAPDRQFWLQLELRTVPPKLSSRAGRSRESPSNLVGYPHPGQDERQTFKAGPLRLADLVRTPRRGRVG